MGTPGPESHCGHYCSPRQGDTPQSNIFPFYQLCGHNYNHVYLECLAACLVAQGWEDSQKLQRTCRTVLGDATVSAVDLEEGEAVLGGGAGPGPGGGLLVRAGLQGGVAHQPGQELQRVLHGSTAQGGLYYLHVLTQLAHDRAGGGAGDLSHLPRLAARPPRPRPVHRRPAQQGQDRVLTRLYHKSLCRELLPRSV